MTPRGCFVLLLVHCTTIAEADSKLSTRASSDVACSRMTPQTKVCVCVREKERREEGREERRGEGRRGEGREETERGAATGAGRVGVVNESM